MSHARYRRTPTWARCVNCGNDLYTTTSYPTDEGYVHSFCPAASKIGRQSRIDDLTWLASTGSGLSEAAQRCGWDKPSSLDSWLRRHAPDVLAALLRNEPRDWNYAAPGEAVCPDLSHRNRRPRRAAA